jgi:hypothetical protein
VLIPFAAALVDLIPPVAVRLRRDAKTVLNLITAHALLHRATRPATPDRVVIATLADYAIVRELVVDLISDAVDATVSKTMRQTVAAVAAELETEVETTYAKLARRLVLDKSASKRRVDAAIAKGYVRNLEPGRGRMAKLVLGDPLPSDVVVLPTPEAVEDRVAGLQPQLAGKREDLFDARGDAWEPGA